MVQTARAACSPATARENSCTGPFGKPDLPISPRAYITAPVRCVPPDNKPNPGELVTCRPYLVRELKILQRVRLVVALGSIALHAYLSVLQNEGQIATRSTFRFGHGARFMPAPGGPEVLASYHPSQQNTATGRLTANMLREIFQEARKIIEAAW
jgi:uracil-DNA glycosylase